MLSATRDALAAADAHQAAGRRTQAEQVLQALVADRPGTAEGWRRLGRLALADGRLEDAEAWLGRARELRPTDPDILAALGRVHLDAGRLDAARLCLERALALDAGRIDARLDLAILADDPTRAEALAREARDLAPDDPAPAFRLGLLAQNRGDPAAAGHWYEQAVALDPQHGDAWNNLGLIRAALGDRDGALAALDRARLAAPDDAEILANFASALIQAGRPAAALPALADGLALNPGAALLLASRGQALMACGRTAEAAEALGAVLKAVPDHPGVLYDMALLARLLGRPDQARRLADQLHRAGQALAATALIGDLAFAAGDPAAAWAALRELPFPARAPVPVDAGAPPHEVILLARALTGRPVTVYRAGLLAPLLAGRPGVTLADGPPPDDAVTLARLAAEAPDHHAAAPWLTPDPDRLAAMKDLLAPLPRPWLGLAWSGDIPHPVAGAHEIGVGDLVAATAAWPGSPIALAPPPAAMAGLTVVPAASVADLVALIAALDAVAAVDGAHAHLAGALARPVAVLLPVAADPRRGPDTHHCPLHPTAHLLRQTRLGDWSGPLTGLKDWLDSVIQS